MFNLIRLFYHTGMRTGEPRHQNGKYFEFSYFEFSLYFYISLHGINWYMFYSWFTWYLRYYSSLNRSICSYKYIMWIENHENHLSRQFSANFVVLWIWELLRTALNLRTEFSWDVVLWIVLSSFIVVLYIGELSIHEYI